MARITIYCQKSILPKSVLFAWRRDSSVCRRLIPKDFENHVQGFSSVTNFPLGQTKILIIWGHHYKHLHNLSQAFDIVLVLTYFISAI